MPIQRKSVNQPVTTPTETKENNLEAIIGLIINLILPGLGTIIAATKHKEYMNTGIIQLVLAFVSIPLMLVLIGLIIYPAVWIWALVTSIIILTKN